ncbi:hypothetical protein ABFX02_12G015100 [Erythranthe guttata]
MKRLSSSDSLGSLIPICPNSTDENEEGNRNPIYTRDFQTMLDGLDEEGCCIEESGHVSEKKRRLSVDQVKALEKNFEVENKLEPERKVKLAQELGLQPRQVAVWFQNRRARWKTKQLERDYGVLKASYDGLKLNFDKLHHDNEALLKEIRELKSNLNGEEEKVKLETPVGLLAASEMEHENFGGGGGAAAAVCGGDLKDGFSDSDSSAILNEENNKSSPIGGVIQQHGQHEFLTGSSMAVAAAAAVAGNNSSYQPQFVKIEEHNFFGEESCSTFFSDDQAPTLHWYCSDQWN